MELDALDDKLGLRENQLLKAVLLTKISVQELLHGLMRGTSFLTFLVVLELELKDLCNGFLELLKGHEFWPIFVEYTASSVTSAGIRSYSRLSSCGAEHRALDLSEKPRSRSGLGIHFLWAIDCCL